MRAFTTLLIAFLLLSCDNEPKQKFELLIERNATSELPAIRYLLTQDSLKILFISDDIYKADSIVFASEVKSDSLQQIPQLDIKAYSCREQHRIDADWIRYSENGIIAEVSPHVNHPEELDIAVRLINSIVPLKFHLQFDDVQRAVEPNDKTEL